MSGAIAVVLFVVAALVTGPPPDLGAPVGDYFGDEQTRLQIGCALFALSAPFLVAWFATVAAGARDAGPGARRAGLAVFGCGVAFVALFMADVTALAVGALRPENMASSPELASALLDFSLVAMGVAAPLAAGVLVACGLLSLRFGALWPPLMGQLAFACAAAYMLRIGTMFTTDGVFAGDGALGLYVPVIALGGWTLVASLMVARR